MGEFQQRRAIFLAVFDLSPMTFCVLFGRICEAFAVNSFAKLYFIGVGPFRLMRHPAMISLPIPTREGRGEFDECIVLELSFVRHGE
jgi:hypothetical protein